MAAVNLKSQAQPERVGCSYRLRCKVGQSALNVDPESGLGPGSQTGGLKPIKCLALVEGISLVSNVGYASEKGHRALILPKSNNVTVAPKRCTALSG